MKQWLDFIPLVLFLLSFKLLDIYSATGILIGSSVLLYGYLWIKEGRLATNHKLVLGLTILLGGLTLAFHNITFLKWKAPIVSWILAAAFLSSHFVGDKLAVERMMGEAMELPHAIWVRLNASWVLFFTVLGFANLYVAFHFSTATWVNFKSLGNPALTFVFVVIQILLISRHLPQPSDESKD